MNLIDTKKKQIATVLRRAKTQLWDGGPNREHKLTNVVNAITYQSFNRGGSLTQARMAQNLIRERLAPFKSVDYFLLSKGIGFTKTQIQAYRHAWLDALILELETGKVTTHYEVPQNEPT